MNTLGIYTDKEHMTKIYFNLADGEVAVTPKNGKWTAEELKSHIAIANISKYHTDTDGENFLVLNQHRKVVVRADEEATKQILEDMANQVRPILAENLDCGEQDIEDLEVDIYNDRVTFSYLSIEIALERDEDDEIYSEYPITRDEFETIHDFLNSVDRDELFNILDLQ